LRTPSLECGILDSITRRHVIEALHVVEGEFELADLRGTREAFLASTTREVQAVSAIDGDGLGGDGTMTAKAAQAFNAALEAELGS
jgi:branched-subunit amino acid aminotransferase/4-amino-4-deoxychorismate lyase